MVAFTTITPAPHKNNLPKGHEHLLSEDSKTILEEYGLTVCIDEQQEPHTLSLPVEFMSIANVMPIFPNKAAADKSLIGATNEETINNVVAAANAIRYHEEPLVTHHWAVYLTESRGRKTYLIDNDLNGKEDAILAGVAYGCDNAAKNLGTTAENQVRFINSQLAVATMFANKELLQIIWRREGKALDMDVVVLKDTGYIDRKIKNRTRNISLRRPAPVMDFSQFV
jgi:hypothetical protein